MASFDIIVFVAHPDDAFIGAGGFIMKMRQLGHNVLVVSMTDGENQGYNGEIRASEFIDSAQFLGVSSKLLHMKDGWLQFEEKELCNAIFEIIKENNPKIILSHSPQDSHSDHKAVAYAVENAIELLFHVMREDCSLRYLMNCAPIRLSPETLKVFCPIYLCDISSVWENKSSAILIHKSQSPYIENNLRKHKALNQLFGSFISCNFAEGFTYKQFQVQENSDLIEKLI